MTVADCEYKYSFQMTIAKKKKKTRSTNWLEVFFSSTSSMTTVNLFYAGLRKSLFCIIETFITWRLVRKEIGVIHNEYSCLLFVTEYNK